MFFWSFLFPVTSKVSALEIHFSREDQIGTQTLQLKFTFKHYSIHDETTQTIQFMQFIEFLKFLVSF